MTFRRRFVEADDLARFADFPPRAVRRLSVFLVSVKEGAVFTVARFMSVFLSVL